MKMVTSSCVSTWQMHWVVRLLIYIWSIIKKSHQTMCWWSKFVLIATNNHKKHFCGLVQVGHFSLKIKTKILLQVVCYSYRLKFSWYDATCVLIVPNYLINSFLWSCYLACNCSVLTMFMFLADEDVKPTEVPEVCFLCLTFIGLLLLYSFSGLGTINVLHGFWWYTNLINFLLFLFSQVYWCTWWFNFHSKNLILPWGVHLSVFLTSSVVGPIDGWVLCCYHMDESSH